MSSNSTSLTCATGSRDDRWTRFPLAFGFGPRESSLSPSFFIKGSYFKSPNYPCSTFNPESLAVVQPGPRQTGLHCWQRSRLPHPDRCLRFMSQSIFKLVSFLVATSTNARHECPRLLLQSGSYWDPSSRTLVRPLKTPPNVFQLYK